MYVVASCADPENKFNNDLFSKNAKKMKEKIKKLLFFIFNYLIKIYIFLNYLIFKTNKFYLK